MTPQEVSQQYNSRSTEVRSLVSLIRNADTLIGPFIPQEARLAWITPREVSILKATTYLHLYNLIEATMAWCHNMIAHAPKRRKKWKPKHLTGPVWHAAISAAITNATNSDTVANRLLPITEQIFRNEPAGAFSYDFQKHDGNWGYDQIKKAAAVLDVQLNIDPKTLAQVTRSRYIDSIKETRNSLAHGNESFEDVGSRITVDEIEEMSSCTLNYLSDIIISYTRFVDQSLFLKKEYRP